MPSVAIVDDEEPIRKALRRLLRAAGIDAESYASGPELRKPLEDRLLLNAISAAIRSRAVQQTR